MSQDATAARKHALFLLSEVLDQSRPLSEIPLRGDPADQARALSSVRGVLRNLTRLDGILDEYLSRRPKGRVMHILRLGAYDIMVGDVADHAAVDQAVRLAKTHKKTESFSGLINAVLRKLLKAEAREKFDTSELRGLPKPFLAAMKDLSAEDAQGIARVQSLTPPVDLTLKSQGDGEAWAERLTASFLPNGSLRLNDARQISALDGFEAGDWWVQDAAASLPVKLLSPAKNLRVLDLCAAPGGKTLQLAAMGAHVTALDISKARLKRVSENLSRCKLEAEIVAADALQYQAEPFDAILLDAPCSASGTIRRHPELPILRPKPNLTALLKLQRAMLKKAVELLKPGGELVYATCSLFESEGCEQAEYATEKLDLLPAQISASDFGLPEQSQIAENAFRLRPHFWAEIGGMDGFFMAKFTKPA